MASGAVATPAVAEDMKTMLEKGKVAADNFMKTIVVEDGPDIYATIKRTKLTFSSMGKKVTNKNIKGDLVALKNSEILFSKMLLIAKNRDLKMENVLKIPFGHFPAPWQQMKASWLKQLK